MTFFQLAKNPKLLAIGLVSLLSLGAVIAGGLYFSGQVGNKDAKASGAVTLYPGQTGEFTLEYSNGGDTTPAPQALLRIFIGDKLQVDTSTFTDQYDGGQTNCMNPSLVKTGATTGTNWGYLVEYRPRSATNGNTNCNGEATAGIADIAPYNEKKGVIKFKAKLKETVTDPAGTVLEPAINQGVYTTIRLNDRGMNISDSVSVIVGQRTNSAPASSAASSLVSSAASSMVSSEATSSAVSSEMVSSAATSSVVSSATSSAPATQVVTPSDIETASCSPSTLQIGTSTTCTFTLKPLPGGATYTLPDGTKAQIDSATGPSDNCTLTTVNNAQAIVCNNVPSTGGSEGLKNVGLTIPGQGTAPDKAKVTLQAAPLPENPFDPSDIESVVCDPATIQIGTPTTCTFNLKPGFVYTTTPGEFKASIGTATGESPACTVPYVSGSTTKFNGPIVCAQTPTTGGTPGEQVVKIRIPGQEPANTPGKVNLTSASPTTIRNGRLYFIGKDDAPVAWNEEIRYNTAYNQGQNFKEGNVKLVFDEIRENANAALWADGNCVFTLSAHTKAQIPERIIRTYQAPISNGKCESNLSVEDQTVNYWHVVVKATRPSSPITITDTNMVVLYVGLNSYITGGVVL